MSLKDRITLLQRELDNLLSKTHPDKTEVLELSRQLDKLIIEFYKLEK